MNTAFTNSKILKGVDLRTNHALARYTSFQVGGPADFFAKPSTREELASLIRIARKEGLPITVLGGGTNTLISDQGIRGLVLVLTRLKATPQLEPGLAKDQTKLGALAGDSLAAICRFAMENSLSGLEWAAGIPGTIGGAVMMNAGSGKKEISHLIESVEVFDLNTLSWKTIKAKNLNFRYRSLELEDTILIKAWLALTPTDPGQIQKAHQAHLEAKRASQPVSQASGGCFFKNPSSHPSAGRLIEEAGLKGYTLNGAMVSALHANFIINYDNATCKDILALKQVIQDQVYKKFGIKLKSEVKAIGN
ncbi:MAG: UDP-N-acetylmuramate dehydrogenase [Desulfobacter sp.]|nr:MAG: UDP-N-acetylmuramate dehydrogenase [Desulfobacter sp.]